MQVSYIELDAPWAYLLKDLTLHHSLVIRSLNEKSMLIRFSRHMTSSMVLYCLGDWDAGMLDLDSN